MGPYPGNLEISCDALKKKKSPNSVINMYGKWSGPRIPGDKDKHGLSAGNTEEND